MIIVVHTKKSDNQREPWKGSTDHWSAHETLEDAREEYLSLLDDKEVLSASITSVIESSDYIV